MQKFLKFKKQVHVEKKATISKRIDEVVNAAGDGGVENSPYHHSLIKTFLNNLHDHIMTP